MHGECLESISRKHPQPSAPLVEEPEQFRWRHVQRLGDLHDVDDRRIPLAALDHADVVPIETGSRRKFILRQAALRPQLAERLSESGEDRGTPH